MELVSYNDLVSGFEDVSIKLIDINPNKEFIIDKDLYTHISLDPKELSIYFIYDNWFTSFWKKLLLTQYSIEISISNSLRDKLTISGLLYPSFREYIFTDRLYVRCIFYNRDLDIKPIISEFGDSSCPIFGDTVDV